MDGVNFEDAKAKRGIEVLEGKVTDHTKVVRIQAPADVEGKEAPKAAVPNSSPAGRSKSKKEEDKSKGDEALQNPAGLDLGRRLLVVLKQPTGTAPKSQQAVRVVDHGMQQKEAVRRLFDAQVLLQSYEEQLQVRDEQLQKVQVEVKRVLRMTSGQSLREPALVEALGLTDEQLQEEGIVAVENKGGASGPAQNGKFEAEVDEAFEEKKWEERQEVERQVAEAEAAAEAAGKEPPERPEIQDEELQWFKIPLWLREDVTTRNLVTNFKKSLANDYNNKGRFDQNAALDHFWQCGLQVAKRWAGEPSEEVVKHAEATEKKSKEIKRQALQESSMLRQHIKRIERKYNEMANNNAEMRKAISTLTANLKEARDTAAMFGVEGMAGVKTGGKSSMVAASFGASGTGQAFGGNVRNSVGGGGGAAGGANQARKSAGGGGGAAAGSAGAGGGGGLPTLDVQMSYGSDFADALGNNRAVAGLFGDDSLDIMADQEQLEEMDHEILEPLDQFDDDVKELMVDCINEKVRRILSLDPSKYKNGRLPFGLKPYKGMQMSDEGMDFEEAFYKLQEEYDRLKEDRDRLAEQLEAARQAAERWKHKFNELIHGDKGKAEEGDTQPAASRLKRTLQEKQEDEPDVVDERTPFVPPPKAVKEKVVKEKAEQEVIIKQGKSGISQAEVDRLLEEQAKEFRAKIEKLERKISQLENEIAALKEKKPREKKEKEEEEEKKERIKGGTKPEREVKEKRERKVNDDDDEPPPAAPESHDAELKAIIQDWVGVCKQTHETLLRVCKKLFSITKHQLPEVDHVPLEKVLQDFIRDKDPETKRSMQMMKKAGPIAEVWVSECLDRYKETCTPEVKDAGAPAVQRTPKAKVEEKIVYQDRIVYQGNPTEVADIKTQIVKQQEEISKLLLTIDELRKRLEGIKAVSLEAGPEVAGQVDDIMAQVGLKEIMEGKAAAPPVLKGVFERLYQDAVQRIQRYGLVRDQMLMANKAYSAVVAALEAKDGQAGEEMPDLDRLNATTAATVNGMWYHTEYLFRRACEYAMAQGVEASLLKTNKGMMSDYPEAWGNLANEGFGDEQALKAARRPDRLPARRSERPGGPRPGGGEVRSHGGSPSSPHKPLRKLPQHPSDGAEPTPFTSYVAALREARGDSPKEDWTEARKLERKIKSELLSDFPKTLKGAVASPPLGTSNSLPALPKGRTMYQASDSDGSPAAGKVKGLLA